MMDFACGEGRNGVAMRTDSVVQWFSSGKPLTAIAVAQLYEKGLIRIEAPVSDYVAEFGTKREGSNHDRTFAHAYGRFSEGGWFARRFELG